MKKFLIKLVLLTPVLSWSAANWIRLGDSEIFYDSNSLKKNGDLVQVTLKPAGPTFNNITYGEIDCPSMAIYLTNEKINILPNTALSDLHNKACNPKWKFWK